MFYVTECSTDKDNLINMLHHSESPPNIIGTLYERIISNLNSEIAFLKEQLGTRDNYFQQEILFLRESLSDE